MKIAFIIPTYNRSHKIGKCIDSIIDFSKATSVEVEIIVCDNKSTDRTIELLASYREKFSNLFFYSRKNFEESGHESLIKLLEETPNTCNWYWIMGDDDCIHIENISLFESILSLPAVDYVHASTPQKKYSDKLLLGPGSELVEKYGLIGLYGFMSSQIISSSILNDIKNLLINYKLNKTYCFSHALLLHQVLRKKNGLIVSEGWVRNIDDTPSAGSGEPWLQTAKFFKEAHDHGILNIPVSSSFLIAEEKFLWRNFICWMINHAFKTKTSINHSHRKLIYETIDLCNDIDLAATEKRLFNIICEELDYIHDLGSPDNVIKNSIIENITNIYNQLSKSCI